jgi:hypothetical protein
MGEKTIGAIMSKKKKTRNYDYDIQVATLAGIPLVGISVIATGLLMGTTEALSQGLFLGVGLIVLAYCLKQRLTGRSVFKISKK